MSHKLTINLGVALTFLLAAVSGCLVNESEPASLDQTGAADVADNATKGPKAIFSILVNGTQVYSSSAGSESPDATEGNTTSPTMTSPAPTGNGTGGNTTAASSDPPATNATGSTATTSASNTTQPTGNGTSGSSGNETGNETGGLSVEPGVNVTFDASASTGDNLTYEWTIGNETFENATFDYVFNETGPVTVTLKVLDLTNATDEASVDLEVASAGPASGTELGQEEHQFNGGAVQGGTPTCQSASSGLTDKTYELTINETFGGVPAQASLVSLTATYGSAGVGARITFLDPAGEELGEAEDTLEVEGPLAPGVYSIVYRLCGVYSSHSTVDVVVTYVSA